MHARPILTVSLAALHSTCVLSAAPRFFLAAADSTITSKDEGETLETGSILGKRDVQAGGKCGSSGGNAICAAGLCCSEVGVCGSDSGACVAPGCQLSFGPACDGNKTPPGRDTSAVPRPLFGNVPYGVDLSHCLVGGKVALTFDDGPYIYTSELLDLLKRNGVKATFFVVGANGGKGQISDPSSGYRDIITRMYQDGHQVGSHTWSHQDMSAITAQQRREQIVRNEIAISSILGVIPTYFRPPYTRVNGDAMNDLKAFGYHVTNYDIDTRDWEGDYAYSRNLYTSILAGHSPSSSSWVSIAHDIQEGTVHGYAQYMIDQARKMNYQLVTIGECMGDPPANWYRDPYTGQPHDPSGPIVKVPPASSESSSSTAPSSSSPPPSNTSKPSSSSSPSSTTSPPSPSSKPSITPTSVSSSNFGAGTGGKSGESTKASSASSSTVSSPAAATSAPSGAMAPDPGRATSALLLFLCMALAVAG